MKKANKKSTLNERVTELEDKVEGLLLKEKILAHARKITAITNKKINKKIEAIRSTRHLFLVLALSSVLVMLFSSQQGYMFLARLSYFLGWFSVGAFLGTLILVQIYFSKR